LQHKAKYFSYFSAGSQPPALLSPHFHKLWRAKLQRLNRY
jgi:hypothetical protein